MLLLLLLLLLRKLIVVLLITLIMIFLVLIHILKFLDIFFDLLDDVFHFGFFLFRIAIHRRVGPLFLLLVLSPTILLGVGSVRLTKMRFLTTLIRINCIIIAVLLIPAGWISLVSSWLAALLALVPLSFDFVSLGDSFKTWLIVVARRILSELLFLFASTVLREICIALLLIPVLVSRLSVVFVVFATVGIAAVLLVVVLVGAIFIVVVIVRALIIRFIVLEAC
jgi:hypothetical protein